MHRGGLYPRRLLILPQESGAKAQAGRQIRKTFWFNTERTTHESSAEHTNVTHHGVKKKHNIQQWHRPVPLSEVKTFATVFFQFSMSVFLSYRSLWCYPAKLLAPNYGADVQTYLWPCVRHLQDRPLHLIWKVSFHVLITLEHPQWPLVLIQVLLLISEVNFVYIPPIHNKNDVITLDTRSRSPTNSFFFFKQLSYTNKRRTVLKGRCAVVLF